MPLVTTDQVATITGKTVQQSDVDLAHSTVQVHAGVDLINPETLSWLDITEEPLSRLQPQDKTQLRFAVAFQAAWLSEQIDYTSRTDVAGVGRDEHALVLAPLASRCLARCTWKRRPTSPDRTRIIRDRLGPLSYPDGVVVSRDPFDNPNQQANFLRDAGPFREVR